MGIFGKILDIGTDLIPGAGAIKKVAKYALPVAGMIAGAKKGDQADQQSQQALDMALARNKELEPLKNRALALALRGQPDRENLDSMFADPGNPYARTISRAATTYSNDQSAPIIKAQQSAKDKAFAAELAGLRRSGKGGDAQAAQALSGYVADNPASQWGAGGANDIAKFGNGMPQAGGGFGGFAKTSILQRALAQRPGNTATPTAMPPQQAGWGRGMARQSLLGRALR